jgi:anaerobic ribonucleoside-triphosphate reductase activating protein
MLELPDDTLNIANIIQGSYIYGPGKRIVIWVQGCAIKCKGCWNNDMWPFEIKYLYRTDELFDMILGEEGLEGITILGGEPLHQSKPLLRLVEMVKAHDYTTILYTGYELGEITDAASRNLIETSDVIISGRYVEEKRSVYLKCRGSSNQTVTVNNSSYRSYFDSEENDVEIHVMNDGTMYILGYLDNKLRDEVLN